MALSSPPSFPNRPDDSGPDERYADERVTHRARPLVGYVALLLSSAYAVLGAVLLLVPNGRLPLTSTYRIALGLLFIAYGIIRTWRAFNKYYR